MHLLYYLSMTLEISCYSTSQQVKYTILTKYLSFMQDLMFKKLVAGMKVGFAGNAVAI